MPSWTSSHRDRRSLAGGSSQSGGLGQLAHHGLTLHPSRGRQDQLTSPPRRDRASARRCPPPGAHPIPQVGPRHARPRAPGTTIGGIDMSVSPSQGLPTTRTVRARLTEGTLGPAPVGGDAQAHAQASSRACPRRTGTPRRGGYRTVRRAATGARRRGGCPRPRWRRGVGAAGAGARSQRIACEIHPGSRPTPRGPRSPSSIPSDPDGAWPRSLSVGPGRNMMPTLTGTSPTRERRRLRRA